MPSTKRALVFLQTMDEGLCFLMPLGHDTVGVTVHRPPYHTCLRNLLGDLTPNKNFGFSYNSAEYLNFWAKFLARLRGKIRRDLLFTNEGDDLNDPMHVRRQNVSEEYGMVWYGSEEHTAMKLCTL